MFGPANFIANVEGKLAGFTWNLVDRYSESVTLEVTEVHADRLIKARFSAIDRFQKSDEREERFTGNILVNEAGFTVHTAILEHRVPCLGFALKEKCHVNIRKDRLEEMNYQSGSWLNELKQYVNDGKPNEHLLRVPSGENGSQEKSLGQLKRRTSVDFSWSKNRLCCRYGLQRTKQGSYCGLDTGSGHLFL